MLHRTERYIPFISFAVSAFLPMVLLLGGTDTAQVTREGKDLFEKRCGGCHALDRDKEGPRLRGIHGRRAATMDTFAYSDALKAAKIVWTDETLDRWLADPEKLVPDNDMSFHVERPDDRQKIIAYLRQNSGK